MPKTKKPQKNRKTAIWLAILFGPLVWIYTYKYNEWKLWLNIVLILATLGIWAVIAWIWAIIDTATKPDTYYKNYYYK